MKKIINEAVTFVTNVIKLRVARLRLRYASYLAMEKHKATGKQYFVLPYSNGKLKVLSTDEIGAMKKGIRVKARTKDGKQTTKKVYMMSPKVTHLDVMRECFYYTPFSLGDKRYVITEVEKSKKAREWIEYANYIRTKRITKR